MELNSTLSIVFEEKFTTKDFDKYVETYFNKCLKYENIIFDLTLIEWIPTEELTFLFAWIRYIKFNHKYLKKIKVNFPQLTPELDNEQYRRRKQRLLNLWNVWRIWEKCELDLSSETNLDESINKYVDQHYQYDSHWHHIIPFTTLDSKNINVLRDIRNGVERNIYNRFNLSSKIQNLLSSYASLSPFENKALSGIISTELFLNSIIHAFGKENAYKECYFAISLRNKINIEEYKEKKHQSGEILSEEEIKRRIDFILSNNINEKNLDEKDFFRDLNNPEICINESFIEFSFLDFGDGIPAKLSNRYRKEENIKLLPLSEKHFNEDQNGEYIINEDSRVLEYAFLVDSSSNPFDKRLEINNYVPRGLYFLVDIIRRYNGLLVVRSGYGKVIFNFKSISNISDAVHFSVKDSELPFFKGTLFSIYLPSKTQKELLYNKLELNLESTQKKDNTNSIVEYLNISELIKFEGNIDGRGVTELYNNIFRNINKKLDSFNNKRCTVYLDFSGTEDIEIVNRKIYFYICNTPRFDTNTKVVIIHPSNVDELLQAREAIKIKHNEIFRAIPCFFKGEKGKVHVIWLGISSEQDEELLNSCLTKNKSYNIDKFDDKTGLVGNVIKINESDFISIDIADVTSILEYFNPIFIFDEIPRRFIKKYLDGDKIVLKQPKIVQENEDYIYWTSGGYYQKKFLTLLDLLYDYETISFGNRGETSNARFGERVSRYLIEKYNYHNEKPLEVDYIITVTLSSQLLGQHIKTTFDRFVDFYQGAKKKPKLIRLTNYHNFDIEKTFNRIKENKKVLIVNDVISTGRLSSELYSKLTKLKNAEVVAIFSIIDSRDKKDNEVKHFFDEKVDQKTYSLIEYPIKKYKSRNSLFKEGNKTIITIDPVINTPSMMKLERSMGNNIVFFENKAKDNTYFLNEYTKPDDLWVGHFEHNQSHHSYYFKTDKILTSKTGEKLIQEIFKQIEFKDDGVNYVFYPMFSAIEETSNNLSTILKDHSNFLTFSLPRIDTPRGWRFAFPPKLLNAIGTNFTKRNVVIIDDGSCSGDTLLQMIDSVAMIEVNEIIAISVVARLEDFQREFFSRLNSIKGFQKHKVEHIVGPGENWDSIANSFDITAVELTKANRDIEDLKIGTIIGIPLKENTTKEIPIKVIFGTHFHIPVYSPLKNCPFCDELNELRNFQNKNLPNPAKDYIAYRIKQLEPYGTDGISLENGNSSYPGVPDYLPMNFDVKKLILARDVIGKIDTYRLYRDYIKDEFSSPELDYYLTVVLHEKRLIESINHLLPHLKYRLLVAIKIKLGIIEDHNNKEILNLNWDNLPLVISLDLLDESSVLNKEYIDIIINSLDQKKDLRVLDYICFKFWLKLKEHQKIPEIIDISHKNIFGNLDGILKKKWQLFIKWICDNQNTGYKKGYEFKYLKDFYNRKILEHPNHHTDWVDFYSLERKILALKQIPCDDYFSGDFIEAKELFQGLYPSYKSQFVDIIEDKDFKNIIRLCGQTESFYSETTSAKKILNNINCSFTKRSNNSLEVISLNLKSLILIYLNPNSQFAKFFLLFEIKIIEEFQKLKAEFQSDLIRKEISYKESVEIDENCVISIHPKCFRVITSELFKNCINHSNGQKTSITCELKDSEEYLEFNFKHFLSRDSDQELVLNGLNDVKVLTEYFGGTFEIVSTKSEFSILLKLLKKNYTDEYNFKN